MSDILNLAAQLLKTSRQLDRDNFNEELESWCWPLADAVAWDNPIDVWTFKAALYYGETIQEEIPAHQLSGGVYNEWMSAIKSDRFPEYRKMEYATHHRVQAVLRNPLMGEVDPFWLMFPNNLNLNNWNPDDIAALMAISAYSNSIRSYKPLGVFLYVHGQPIHWVSMNLDDPIAQASQGLSLLEQPLQKIAELSYKRGTFQ